MTTTSKCFHVVLPLVFLTVAVLAWIQMGNEIGRNLSDSIGNYFRQMFFQRPKAAHWDCTGAWFWTSVTCFVCGLVSAWLSFRRFKHDRSA